LKRLKMQACRRAAANTIAPWVALKWRTAQQQDHEQMWPRPQEVTQQHYGVLNYSASLIPPPVSKRAGLLESPKFLPDFTLDAPGTETAPSLLPQDKSSSSELLEPLPPLDSIDELQESPSLKPGNRSPVSVCSPKFMASLSI